LRGGIPNKILVVRLKSYNFTQTFCHPKFWAQRHCVDVRGSSGNDVSQPLLKGKQRTPTHWNGLENRRLLFFVKVSTEEKGSCDHCSKVLMKRFRPLLFTTTSLDASSLSLNSLSYRRSKSLGLETYCPAVF